MRELLQSEVEERTLRALYDLANSGSTWVDAAYIAGALEDGVSQPRVQMALRTLEQARLIRGRHNTRHPSVFEISEAGYKAVEADLVATAEDANSELIAPAADRVVRFCDNSPEYVQAGDLIVQITNAVEGDNAINSGERSRLRAALRAASELWQATELKIIQIKVGILMALEDVRPWAREKFYDALLAGAIALVRAFIQKIGLSL